MTKVCQRVLCVLDDTASGSAFYLHSLSCKGDDNMGGEKGSNVVTREVDKH